MLFKYKGINSKGAKEAGNIEAENKNEAFLRLKQRGIFASSIKKQRTSIIEKLNFRKKEKINPNLLSRLSKDISIYLDAGISIVSTIKLAANQNKKNKKVASFLNSITTYLDEGKSFGTSLEAQKIYEIPNFFIQSVKISENGGILSEVLEEMSKFLKDSEKTKKQVKSSLFYPGFILAVAFLMIAFMVTIIVPKITSLFEQMGQELPAITIFIVNLSNFLSNNWLLLVGILIVTVSIFNAALRFNQPFRYSIHLFLLKVPFFSRIILTNELARFSYMMSVLLKSGVSFVQGISLCANVLDNEVIKKVFKAASIKVVEGGKLSQTLTQSSYIDEAFVQAIVLGEETSELQKILYNMSKLYFEENSDRLKLFLSLLEPALMLFVGAAVGTIVVAMLLPIFSMNIGG